MFLFPFLKELFIGKDSSVSRKGKIKEPNQLLKQFIIILGCASVALNVYLTGKAFNLGRENLELQKQIKEPNPKPILYPNSPTTKKEQTVVTNYPTPDPDEQSPKKRLVRLPSALPPERESYLKELEAIDKIQ